MHRRGWTSQMPNAIHLKLDWLGDIMADQFETGMANPLADVVLSTSKLVIQADHLITLLHKAIHEMRSHKAGTAGDQMPLHHQPSPTVQTCRPAARASWVFAIALVSNNQAGRRIKEAIGCQSRAVNWAHSVRINTASAPLHA